MKNAYLVVLSAVAFVGATACGSGSGGSTAPTAAAPSPYIAGFDPPPVAAGYTRFITPPLQNIPAGSSLEWCQWVAAPSDEVQDVLNATGMQSQFGHHVVLYAQSEIEPVGTSRICTSGDTLSIQYLGGIGGDGVSSADIASYLPPNTAFQLPKGQTLMANVHFLNTSDQPIDGQAVMDLQFVAPAGRQIAGFFINDGDTFSIPPHATTSYDVNCPIAQDMSFFLFGNHMHNYGAAVYTELLHSDGTSQMIMNNTYWTPDMQFNPPIAGFKPGGYLEMQQGDTLHTHCEWTGASDETITFPTEMCIGFGFNLTGGASIYCDDGQWPTSP
jgi:hypothetical protein